MTSPRMRYAAEVILLPPLSQLVAPVRRRWSDRLAQVSKVSLVFCHSGDDAEAEDVDSAAGRFAGRNPFSAKQDSV
jgi:hypothetical protein